MLSRRLLARLLGADPLQVRVLEVAEDASGAVLVAVRARARWAGRCPVCSRRCVQYDAGRPRRWRALDLGRVQAFVTARVPRVSCPEHGVRTAAVPWARPGARHTLAFEQVAAWCAVQMSATAATRLLRCSWRTIGAIVARVGADLAARGPGDGLDGLRRIGLDEISYRRGRQYLVVVVDHDSRRLVWAAPGRSRATVAAFFDQLGPARTAALTHVSADGATWITATVAARAPGAVLCLDPFHVVTWATAALDEVRRATWNAVRTRAPRHRPATGAGKPLKDARWALWKNPQHLTDAQRGQLAWIAATHPDLHRAWQLKEALRAALQLTGTDAIEALERWLDWARRSRLEPFVRLARTITSYRQSLHATLTCKLSNALVESTNTKIRLITRRAYGFRNIHALIALAKLSVGLHPPQLPT